LFTFIALKHKPSLKQHKHENKFIVHIVHGTKYKIYISMDWSLHSSVETHIQQTIHNQTRHTLDCDQSIVLS